MGNTRIRYTKQSDGMLQSVRSIEIDQEPGRVFVKLDVDNFKFYILEPNTMSVLVEGGKTKNLAVLKRQAKRMLTQLGASFGEEKRNKSV